MAPSTRIRHNDNLMVSQLGYIKIIGYTTAKCRYHGSDFLI